MSESDTRQVGPDPDAEMAGIGRFTWEYLRMHVALLLRYKVNFAGQLVTTYLLFAVVFYGGQAAARRLGQTANLGDGLEGFIVGWFLLSMVNAAYGSLANGITQESRRGTLEQLYLSPYGFSRVMVSNVAIQILLSVLTGSVLLVLMLLTTGRTITVDLITVLPIVVLTLFSVVGIGLVLAGLTLVYKQISSIISIVRFVVIVLVGAPLLDIPVLRYLPVAQGSILLQEAMTESTALWEFPPGNLFMLGLTAVGYYGIGYLLFAYCLRVARVRGVMGHY